MSAATGDSSNGSDDNEWSDGLHTLDAVHQLTKPKNRIDMIWTTLRVAGQPLKIEVDTGSAYSVIPHHVYKEMLGELVVPEGKLRVQVKHKKQKVKLDLYVIKGGRQVLFGRDWFWEIKLDLGEIHSLKSYDGTSKDISLKDANKQVQWLLAKYKLVSTESLGTLKGVKAKLTVEEGVQPKFCKP